MIATHLIWSQHIPTETQDEHHCLPRHNTGQCIFQISFKHFINNSKAIRVNSWLIDTVFKLQTFCPSSSTGNTQPMQRIQQNVTARFFTVGNKPDLWHNRSYYMAFLPQHSYHSLPKRRVCPHKQSWRIIQWTNNAVTNISDHLCHKAYWDVHEPEQLQLNCKWAATRACCWQTQPVIFLISYLLKPKFLNMARSLNKQIETYSLRLNTWRKHPLRVEDLHQEKPLLFWTVDAKAGYKEAQNVTHTHTHK